MTSNVPFMIFSRALYDDNNTANLVKGMPLPGSLLACKYETGNKWNFYHLRLFSMYMQFSEEQAVKQITLFYVPDLKF